MRRLDFPTFERPRKATSGTAPGNTVRNLAVEYRRTGGWELKNFSAWRSCEDEGAAVSQKHDREDVGMVVRFRDIEVDFAVTLDWYVFSTIQLKYIEEFFQLYFLPVTGKDMKY